MDLVINHTSDQHPWFKSARSSPDSEYRDWYMWSNTKNRFTEARIIFLDTETSNWTWDDEAGAYYFHRFFSHQPDLNYDNPRVRAEIIDVCRFWLDLGMDGFRLDAVPYLFKREGTNCENLPETHAFLADLRAAHRRRIPGQGAPRGGEPVARGRGGLFRLAGAARMPHVLQLSIDAADVHGPAPRAALSRSPRSSIAPRRCRPTASGASSCATTTSSPSRW